ncbi:uncharacterized protein LOC733539 [Xenopus tropicalis]|nr:uncharacterized protein LOC733539 [Xenopus tropicalis]CAJ81870.1 novel protein [Xenopus tropicalis]|eukprot:NP_001037923.1 uncharacterized protein LOC733539 [Xenopus tropicalis]
MDLGFVATAQSSSSPCSSGIELLDQRTRPKPGGSPFLLKVSESSPLVGGEKQRMTVEEIVPCLSRSPFPPPDGQVFELSALAPEPLSNSIVGVFYGAKVSTPYKEEATDAICVDIQVPKLQDSEMVVQAVGVQKPSVPPIWELSEINSALEENTPTLDVSVSDLRFTSSSDRDQPSNPQVPASQCTQWVGVTHKDVGRSFLQPFRYQRQLSASEIPVTSNTPLLHSFHLSADEVGGEWHLEVTT